MYNGKQRLQQLDEDIESYRMEEIAAPSSGSSGPYTVRWTRFEKAVRSLV